MNWADIDFDNPYLKDIGTYEPPSWTVDDNFFKYDPKETGGIDWSDIYANQDVLSGSGNGLFDKTSEFLKKFSEGYGTEEQSQYFDSEKAATGLPTNKSRESWYQQISPSVGIYGGSGGIYGGGGAGSMVLPAIQAGQSLAGMQGMPSMGFKDVTRFAGDVGNTIASGVGSAVKGVGNFIGGLFCDERLKVDIAPLESTEVNDELAQMAFFVKGLRECS